MRLSFGALSSLPDTIAMGSGLVLLKLAPISCAIAARQLILSMPVITFFMIKSFKRIEDYYLAEFAPAMGFASISSRIEIVSST